MKLIIFDFDGVLVDTLGIVYTLNREIDPDLSLEQYKSFYKGNIHNAIKADGSAKSYRSDFDDEYSERTRELKVPDELKRIVSELSSKYTLAIVSSTSTASIKNILEREGIYPSFSDISGSDVHKNKSFKIKAVMEKYKVTPEESVYITDTVGDIMEARACGVRAIAVTWGYHDEKTIAEVKPAKIVRTPAELLKTIKEI
ncbi:MAG TPA: HAD family hydrolase [Candidatus Paceibacterota bacterium]|nr:HAD family hydrolase [Candidatus Paceibacterota bacterium]